MPFSGTLWVNLKVAIDESRAEVMSDPLPTVCLHEFQLEQLFQNIIGNAIHYRSEARSTYQHQGGSGRRCLEVFNSG